MVGLLLTNRGLSGRTRRQDGWLVVTERTAGREKIRGLHDTAGLISAGDGSRSILDRFIIHSMEKHQR